MLNRKKLKLRLEKIAQENDKLMFKNSKVYTNDKKCPIKLKNYNDVDPKIVSILEMGQNTKNKSKIMGFTGLSRIANQIDKTREKYKRNLEEPQRISNFLKKIEKSLTFKNMNNQDNLFFLDPEDKVRNFYLLNICFINNFKLLQRLNSKSLDEHIYKLKKKKNFGLMVNFNKLKIDKQDFFIVKDMLLKGFPFFFFQKQIKKELLKDSSFQFFQKAKTLNLVYVFEEILEKKSFKSFCDVVINQFKDSIFKRKAKRAEIQSYKGIHFQIQKFFSKLYAEYKKVI